MSDCAFPPFWLWLSPNPGNSAQTEKRGRGLEAGQIQTKRMTETDQDQEAFMKLRRKWSRAVLPV